MKRILAEVRPYTMVHPESLEFTVALAIDAIERGLQGPLVECGTWKGGASFAMLLAQRYAFGKIVKPVWMFDSFEGLPDAQEKDGAAAQAWQAATDEPSYFNNCTADLAETMEAARCFGFSNKEAIIVPGWFAETLPANIPALEETGIAALRVDCDWYQPVKQVLDDLTPLLADGGKVLLDDYYAWDGCVRATHDFLSENDLPWRLRSIGRNEHIGAWMMKQT